LFQPTLVSPAFIPTPRRVPKGLLRFGPGEKNGHTVTLSPLPSLGWQGE